MSQFIEIKDLEEDLFGELEKLLPLEKEVLCDFFGKLVSPEKDLFVNDLQSLCIFKAANESLLQFLERMLEATHPASRMLSPRGRIAYWVQNSEAPQDIRLLTHYFNLIDHLKISFPVKKAERFPN